MKIAIQHREGSFSDRWIQFCIREKIPYILVDVYSNNILGHLSAENVTHFMWHFHHSKALDLYYARLLFSSVENLGIKCFPNFNTRWHFDDKIAQKFLLESIGAPVVPSYVFFEKGVALKHIENIQFPIVAKLKRGAGATNVKMLKNITEASIYIDEIFNNGFSSNSGSLENLGQKIRVAKKIKNPITLIKKVVSHFVKNKKETSSTPNEKGYFYYQKFLPKNDYDTRIIVVGDKAVGIRRYNRKGDFRASGSGKIGYSIDLIDVEAVRIAFDVTKKLGTQCLAFDFIYDSEKKLKIVEVSYSFTVLAYDYCEGYWDENLVSYPKKINLQEEMMRLFVY